MKKNPLPDNIPCWRLDDLSQLLNLDYQGSPEQLISGIGTLQAATKDQLSFLANPFYHRYLDQTKAGIVILKRDTAIDYPGNALLSDNPYLSYACFAEHYANSQRQTQNHIGIHNSAHVHPDADIAEQVSIGPNSVIGADVSIDSGTNIAAGVIIDGRSSIGKNCQIMAGAWIGAGSRLGNRVRVHPGACLGSDGFGLAWAGENWQKVPQLGGLRVGDDCEIGANTTIDRGSIEDTVLEVDVRLDNQIQIAHNVHIGAHTAIAACTGIAGSTTIGANCLVGGGCGIGGHLTIGSGIELTGMSMVTRSLNKPGRYGSAMPAEPERTWHRNIARLRQLDRYWQRIGNNKQRK